MSFIHCFYSSNMCYHSNYRSCGLLTLRPPQYQFRFFFFQLDFFFYWANNVNLNYISLWGELYAHRISEKTVILISMQHVSRNEQFYWWIHNYCKEVDFFHPWLNIFKIWTLDVALRFKIFLLILTCPWANLHTCTYLYICLYAYTYICTHILPIYVCMHTYIISVNQLISKVLVVNISSSSKKT